MTLADGFPAASGTVDSTELRKNLAGLILRDTSGNPRAGVFPRHTNALVTSKASMAVDVAAFEGCAVRGGGPIFMSNDGTVAVTVDAAPGSNSRIDVVYFKQNESASPYSDANNNPIFGVEKGTAAPSPSKPTIPTGAVELATILIPAGVSATNAGGVVITQTFQYTALTGTPLWVRNSTERGALGTYAVGTALLQLDTVMLYRHDGSSFVAGGVAAGTLTAGANCTINTDTELSREGTTVRLSLDLQRSTGSFTAGDTIATLPAGFRPAKFLRVPVVTWVGAGTITLAYLYISSAGVVQIYGVAASQTRVYGMLAFAAS